MLQLGGFQFLDFTSEDDVDFTIAVHSFAKVLSISGEELRVVFFGTDWLEDRIEEDSFPSYEKVGRNRRDMVLTGSTRDLQQFVLSHAIDPRSFEGSTSTFRKVL